MDFQEVLGQNKKKVYREIQKYLADFGTFPDFCQIAPRFQPLLDFHNQLVNDYPHRQGKYLRPTLLLLTAQSLGVPYRLALKTAAAMQISEDWILNHDDVEDDSLYRRGLPALHRLYSKELAFNAGDALHVLMWHILRDNKRLLGPAKTLAVIDEFTTMLQRTIFGQTVEIKWFQENNLHLTDEDIFFISESKTGYYTIAGPMRLGAILADASKSQLSDLYHFGLLLGSAFQIKDDLLDLTSTFGGLKNQQGNDIYEGKRTLMLAHLLRSVSPADHARLTAILSRPRSQKTQAEVDWVIAKMQAVGSLDYAASLAADLAARSRELFETKLTFLKRQPYRNQLQSAIEFIVNRTH
ncbi:polyprenyl synthetase family protein [Patescibacteria group bacterium]|nr:polyprenyl synthetase family protein [Patescibacteria group bacterium]